jgi:hypothetical protein
MKKGTILALLLTLFLLFGAAKVSAQEISVVVVKGHELNNGVVVLDIVKDGNAYELTCNEGYSGCNPLRNGTYVMVELPKNFGMYECRNVELYPESDGVPEKEKKLGDYCLAGKK